MEIAHDPEPQLSRAGWTRIFVYGTLKRDQVNYPFWMPKSGSCVFKGEGRTVHKYPLFVNEGKFGSSPCLMDAKDEFPDTSYRVYGEVYDVSPQHLEDLNTLEGVSVGVYAVGSVKVEWTPKPKLAVNAETGEPLAEEDVADCSGCSEPPSVFSDCGVYFRIGRIPEDWRTTRKFIESFEVKEAILANPDYAYIVPQLKKEHYQALAVPIPKLDPMVLLIIDGVGDVSYEQFGGQTPLQYLRTYQQQQRQQKNHSTATSGATSDAEPSTMMDRVAKIGINGLMDSVVIGESCGSDTAHLSMFGYDPIKYYEGRGAFEAMGAGMEMEVGTDIAFKSNFATLDTSSGSGTSEANPTVLARRCDRNFEKEGPILCEYLNGLTVKPFSASSAEEEEMNYEYEVRVQYATEHRCGVVISGPGLNAAVSGTDPLKDGCPLRKCVPTATAEKKFPARSKESNDVLRTCKVIDAVSAAIQQKLEVHPINAERIKEGKKPANVVLLRGAAMKSECPQMVMRHGLRSFMVAPTCIIAGLGKTLGMDILKAPGATGDYHSDFNAKAKVVLENIKSGQYEFAVLHIKAVDDAGHDKDPRLKLEMLDRVDKMLEEVLWPGLPDNCTLAITGDHSTSCHFGDHSCEPVPVTVATKLPVAALKTANNGASNNPLEFASSSNRSAAPLWQDEVDQFDEVSCAQSWLAGLGRFDGIHLLDIMKRYHRHRFLLEE